MYYIYLALVWSEKRMDQHSAGEMRGICARTSDIEISMIPNADMNTLPV